MIAQLPTPMEGHLINMRNNLMREREMERWGLWNQCSGVDVWTFICDIKARCCGQYCVKWTPDGPFWFFFHKKWPSFRAGNRVWTVWKRSDVSGTNGLDGLDGLETVWCVWNHARSFGNSILIIFLFLKISIGRLLPELVFRGWKSGLDGLETVWGVWNQAKISGNSILNTFLFWKMSIRRRVPELVPDRTKKQLVKGGGRGGHFPIVKKCLFLMLDHESENY